MKKALKAVVLLGIAAALLAVPARAQIKLEITGFGGFGFNMAFASTVDVDSVFASNMAGAHNAWQAFFHDPVLELKAGPSLGGRVALWFTPRIGIEGSFEYSMQKPRFNEAAVADLDNLMDALGYSSEYTMVAEGGSMVKLYGNIIFNLMPAAKFSPYLTAGIGMTSYKVTPNISIVRSSWSESLSLLYADTSALTFNGGAGFKYWFTPKIGLRVDARLFFGSPKFEQTYSYEWLGFPLFEPDNYVTQSGSHVDAVITVGVVIRVM